MRSVWLEEVFAPGGPGNGTRDQAETSKLKKKSKNVARGNATEREKGDRAMDVKLVGFEARETGS